MAKKTRYGAAEAASPALSGQPLSREEKALVDEAYRRLEIFGDGCREMHARARIARRIALLEDPEQDAHGTPPNQRTLQLHTLKSTLNNCVADQMDNMPDARLTPERPELREVADDLSDIVRFILERNDFESVHAKRVEDFFVTGTAVTQIAWDEEMDGGRGNVALVRWPIEGFLWDPVAEDIQDGRACIKVSWHPMSWYADHFPEAARYVGGEGYATNEVGVPDAWAKVSAGDEPRAMLMEYWYRRYDAKKRRHSVHVAYIAGRALLYLSERERPEGMYSHGQYPFVLDAYTRIEGVPVGDGMVHELAALMRYINRCARYVDENLRMSSKVKLLVRRGAGIDTDALLDMNKALVEGDNIDADSVHPYETKQFNGAAMSSMLQMQSDMKQDSGQNQFSRGETAGGVNAASAIAMLQEAGGKSSRMRTNALNRGFRRMVEQIIWLVSDYYSKEKAFLVTGRGDQQRFVKMDRDRMYSGDAAKGGAKKSGDNLPPPPYSVRVQVQRRNPLQIQARNETVMQMYTMYVQTAGNPEMQRAFPLSTLLEMLDMEGKEEMLPLLRLSEQRQDVMLQQAQIMAQQEQALAASQTQIANLEKTLQGMAQATGDTEAAGHTTVRASPAG